MANEERGRLLNRLVVGVFGNAQHGKDTVGKLLVGQYETTGRKRPKQFALADPVKEVAKHLLGMPDEVAYGVTGVDREALRNNWRLYGRNGREWLQWIGTELGREMVDWNLWLDRAVDTIVMDTGGHDLFVITDCRFENERSGLRKRLEHVFIPFVTVRVKRPGEPVDMSHQSESEVAAMSDDLFDHVIVNDGSLADLDMKVHALASELAKIDATR